MSSVACSAVIAIFDIYQPHSTDQNTCLCIEKLKVIYLIWVPVTVFVTYFCLPHIELISHLIFCVQINNQFHIDRYNDLFKFHITPKHMWHRYFFSICAHDLKVCNSLLNSRGMTFPFICP